MAQAVLALLTARGVALTEAQRVQILRCDDHDLVSRYLTRAVMASAADEVLRDGEGKRNA